MEIDRIEGRLINLATLFLVLYGLTLTISPAVQSRSLQVDYIWPHWIGIFAWVLVFKNVHHRFNLLLPNRDPFFLPVTAFLSGWGALTIFRLVPDLGVRQFVWLVIAGIILWAGARAPSDLEFFRRYKYLWLTGSLLLTAATILFGVNPLGYGPRMWLGCCGLYFQPSEPLKLLFIAYLAAYMSDMEPLLVYTRIQADKRSKKKGIPDYLISNPTLAVIAPTIILIGLALTLLIIQRDMGTASIFVILYAVILYMVSGSKRLIGLIIISLILAGVAGYFYFSVVQVRVNAWLNPWLDPTGGSYQIVQSLISIATGGFFGRGPGVGNPGIVPIAHSDLIYSAIVEEIGILGAIGLLILFAIFAVRGILTAVRAENNYHRYLAAGLTVYLVGQSLLIISGSLRILPLTGVTLLFVSYGGSSLVTSFISLLLLVHISHNSNQRGLRYFQPALRYPYYHITIALFIGLIIAALATGWWGLYREADLITRTDNPRRSISDRFIHRGMLLDRFGTPINQTIGEVGDLKRLYNYPEFGSVVGYNDPIYGQSGLEASLDPYLRGTAGNPEISIWWNRLLYGQPPPGLDVGLTLDVKLQKFANDLLSEHSGGLVLMDAKDGQIFVMASKPSFDPNTLDNNWQALLDSPDAPLLNRSSQGQYSPGAVLAPLIYAKVIDDGLLPNLSEEMDEMSDKWIKDCAMRPHYDDLVNAIAGGCPEVVIKLAKVMGSIGLLEYFESLGFFDAPQLRLPVSGASIISAEHLDVEAVLFNELKISPLQLAIAASVLSIDGQRAAPQIARVVETSEQEWEEFPSLGNQASVLTPEAVKITTKQLRMDDDMWQEVAFSNGTDGRVYTWYLGGNTACTYGREYVLAMLLEEEDPELALRIGNKILSRACRIE